MSKPIPVFVIPTYRLREVGQTVEAYDDQFRHNGHALDLIVFDDSSVANQEKYYQLLEKTRTFNPLHYVGPQEKEQFLNYLFGRLRDRKLEPLIRNLFRPSDQVAPLRFLNDSLTSSPKKLAISCHVQGIRLTLHKRDDHLTSERCNIRGFATSSNKSALLQVPLEGGLPAVLFQCMKVCVNYDGRHRKI